ncbi:MAG: ABC transporter permease, partial [Chloroflexota bacterium]
MKNFDLSRLNAIIVPLIAGGLGLLVGAGMLLALGANPLDAYAAMLQGAFGSPNAFADTLVKASPLLFVGIGTCIA